MPKTQTSSGIRISHMVVNLAEDGAIRRLYANGDVTYGDQTQHQQVDLLTMVALAVWGRRR